MEIHLDKIGIIKKSSIKLDGLTVITGNNNSGKTTVGKVLYAVLDSVSNLQRKAKIDKQLYIYKQINTASDLLESYQIYKYIEIDDKFINFFNGDLWHTDNADFEYAKELINYISSITIPKDQSQRTSAIMKRLSKFEDAKNKAINDLRKMLDETTKDPAVIDYATMAINRALNLEFDSQIQPVVEPDARSHIEITEGDTKYFNISLSGNNVVKKQVFFYSPYQKVFLIDNPFIIDEPARAPSRAPSLLYRYGRSQDTTWFDSGYTLKHNDKLQYVIHDRNAMSILEEQIISSGLRPVMDIINDILPGDFISKQDGEYYVDKKGVRLKLSNLATGSKFFSIIKILLKTGNINSETMLILDEPESHLRPEWQNILAEVIVVIIKELKAKVLVTTHSSNMMLALDANMRKYEINQYTNFYKTVVDDEDTRFRKYECVNDNIGIIYDDFVQYLSKMKSLRDQYIDDED